MLFFSTALEQRSLRGSKRKAPFVYLQCVDVFACVCLRVRRLYINVIFCCCGCLWDYYFNAFDCLNNFLSLTLSSRTSPF